MSEFKLLSAAEQAANHLRERILSGIWGDEIPGAPTLAEKFGINHVTVIAALQLLEHEGLLVNQGVGRRRKIVLPEDHTTAALRVAIMDFDFRGQQEDFMTELAHRLEKAGHVPFFTDKTLVDLGRDLRRVARFVKKTEADAWIVMAGSYEILEWFSEQETPAFALFGSRAGLPIAGVGPDKDKAIAEATRRLIALGHRRISLLCRREIRLPQPSPTVHAFLSELEAAGIATGAFNLPDWEESSEGFERILDSLFGPTPPTALILDESFLFNVGFYSLARRGLRVPQDISLICTDDPDFAWCQPTVAHIRWEYRPVMRRAVRWANNVSQGKEDLRQSFTKAEFVEGGTVGRSPE